MAGFDYTSAKWTSLLPAGGLSQLFCQLQYKTCSRNKNDDLKNDEFGHHLYLPTLPAIGSMLETLQTALLLVTLLPGSLIISESFLLQPLEHKARAGLSHLAHNGPEFMFSLSLDNGADVQVSMRCDEDATRVAAHILKEHPDLQATQENLSTVLLDQLRKVSPAEYVGPQPKPGEKLTNVIATLPVGKTGIVLNVAQSLLSPTAGFGLFLSKDSPIVPNLAMYQGQPLCGYAGRPSAKPLEEGGRTIVNCFTSLSSDVFFENELQPLGRVIASKRINHVVGHRILTNECGDPVGIEPDESYAGEYRYFISDNDACSGPFNLMQVGQFANDLAITTTPSGGVCINRVSWQDGENGEFGSSEGGIVGDEYLRASKSSNILALTFRMELDGADQRSLKPLPPILTFSRSAVFSSDTPLEVGCHYGIQYWERTLCSLD